MYERYKLYYLSTFPLIFIHMVFVYLKKYIIDLHMHSYCLCIVRRDYWFVYAKCCQSRLQQSVTHIKEKKLCLLMEFCNKNDIIKN